MKTLVIPAVDIMDGRTVRLTRGDYSRRKDYDCDPVEMARRYQDCGVKRLHLVDLDGARAREPRNLRVLERIASGTSMEVEWGGGVKTAGAFRQVVDAGAGRVICGSIAVDDRELFLSLLSEYGTERVVLGADLRDGKVATHGWLRDSEVPVGDLLGEYVPAGLSQVICTDISRDGMLQGPDFGFYSALQLDWPGVDVILSGGVSCIQDILTAEALGIRGVIVGKAIYEGRITPAMLQALLSNESDAGQFTEVSD